MEKKPIKYYKELDYMKKEGCTEDTCSFCNVCNVCSDHKSNFNNKNNSSYIMCKILKKIIHFKKKDN